MKRRSGSLLMVVLMLVVSAGLAACSGAEPAAEPAGTEPAATMPAEEPAGGAAEPAAGAADDAGQALVNTKCSMCHTLERVESATYDEAGWTAVVERMEKAGLVVTADEKAQIIATLAGGK